MFDHYRAWLHHLRNRDVAHLDPQVPVDEILDDRRDADPDHLFRFADEVVDLLDYAAGQDTSLCMLALRNRALKDLKPARAGSRPAALEFDANRTLLDTGMVAWTAGGFAHDMAPRAAGILAGRRVNRRSRWFSVPAAEQDAESAAY